VPAAAVIPALIAYIKVVAVKKLVAKIIWVCLRRNFDIYEKIVEAPIIIDETREAKVVSAEEVRKVRKI